MSFLYPLFLLGAAAVSVPIILHMIRRQTQKQQLFSSLMFLKESRPRYQKRSKIEHWLLLLLRCLALILLALAFMRPFFSEATETTPDTALNRKVILIDTSASMRREGLWEQALARIDTVLAEVDIEYRVSVITFDGQPHTVIDFEQWQLLEPEQRVLIVSEEIRNLSPTWQATSLDQALMAAVRMIEEDEINTQAQAAGAQQIILISDLQQGAQMELLHTFHWPEEVFLTAEPVTAKRTTNASLNILAEQNIYASPEEDTLRRVRIWNSPDAIKERFVLTWDNHPSESGSDTMEVYVAPGQSVVVNVPYADELQQRLQINDDDNSFDNQHFVSAPVREKLKILYLGDEEVEDTRSMSFFLDRAFQPTRLFDPEVSVYPADEPLADIDLKSVGFIMVADHPAPENLKLLQDYLQAGKTILIVMKTTELVDTISALTGTEQPVAEEVAPDDYAMLGELDLNHPVLKPFDDPRYSDFTQIHFWRYRRLWIEEVPEVQVMARFDSGDPAWFTLPAGAGQLVVLTSGWHPTDSQLALSTKFVPLIYSILEFGGAIRNRQFQYEVGQPLQAPTWMVENTSQVQWRLPDDSQVTMNLNQDSFFVPEEPGFYTLESEENTLLYAVNISPQESQTAPMTVEELETFGVSLEPQDMATPDLGQQTRPDRVSMGALESEQKLWRWILLATIFVLLLETGLAGLLSREPTETKGVST